LPFFLAGVTAAVRPAAVQDLAGGPVRRPDLVAATLSDALGHTTRYRYQGPFNVLLALTTADAVECSARAEK
jgi:hypothetical protein